MRCYCCPRCLTGWGLRDHEVGCPACGYGRLYAESLPQPAPIRGFTFEVDGQDEYVRRLMRALGREIEAIQRERQVEFTTDNILGSMIPYQPPLPFQGTLTVKQDIK